MTPLRREVECLLEARSQCEVSKTEGTCREILKRREALWTFMQVEGVEPTNHTAERSIRPGVQYRKGNFGTQSEDGSRFVESMMTLVATLKQQKRNVLDFLTAAHEVALRGEAAPSLLPDHDQLRFHPRLPVVHCGYRHLTQPGVGSGATASSSGERRRRDPYR